MSMIYRDRNPNHHEAGNIIATRIVSPQTEAAFGKSYICSIKRANEKNNACDVEYKDESGTIIYKTGVPVDLTNILRMDFPRIGDRAVVKCYGDKHVVTHVLETDLNSFNSKHVMHSDRSTDGDMSFNAMIILEGNVD